MFDLSTVLFLLAAAAMCAIAVSYRSGGIESRRELFRKVAGYVLLVTLGYLFLAVPFVGYFYDSSSKLEFSLAIDREQPEGKYLADHHARIEHLESELKEAKDDLKELRDHYRSVLNLGFVAILLLAIHLTSTRIKTEDEGS